MSLQDSTFNTTHVLDNEIVKANDFEFAFENLINNVSKATQMFLESNQDFVINGKVLPYEGMNVQISPIYGVCKTNGLPFGRTETAVMEYGFEESSSGRIDIIEVQGGWETYDNQQRAFNDPDTDTQTYQYVDTKKLMRPVYRIKKGVEGANVAPEVDEDWVKLAEVVIEANSSEITAENIKNITSDVAGLPNTDWTTQQTITYNIGYISDINARFRVQHNEDGTHKDDVIDTDSLNIGVGTKQVNGNVLPVGATVSIPGQSVAATDSMLSVFVKIAAMITSLYNAYLKYGNYGFKGSLSVSAIADSNNVLTNPITLVAAGDGTANIKIGNNTVLSIDSDGKLSTNGYTATSANHIVTKAVTDAITTALNNLTQRVTNLENVSDSSLYANGTLSMGENGRYNLDSSVIYVATTQNIVLSNLQTIDGFSLTSGVFVLVKNQDNAKENGIYLVSENLWQRVTNFNTPEKLKGKLFFVVNGTINGGKIFYIPKVNFNSDSSFGTDDINFLEYMATSRPLANRVVMRDTCGRAQVAAPTASNDIARKAEIDNLYGNVAGSPLGTAAVGTADTFARSDHVHPARSNDTFVVDSGKDGNWNEGIRINQSPEGVATLVMGGTRGSVEGCSCAFSFHTLSFCPGKLFVAYQNSSVSSYFCCNSDGSVYWNGTSTYALSAGSAGNAACVGGLSVSTGACANTVVARNGDGHIYGSYFNSAIGNENIQSYSGAQLIFSGADCFLRRTDPSYVTVGCATRAASADSAGSAGTATYGEYIMNHGVGWAGIHWSAQSGQPTWLFGSNNGTDIFIWNPSNFSVSYATTAGSATTADSATTAGSATTADSATTAGSANSAAQLQATYVTNVSAAGVWRDGSTLYNNSGHTILYFSDDTDEQVFPLFSGQSTAIGSGGNYYYVTLG